MAVAGQSAGIWVKVLEVSWSDALLGTQVVRVLWADSGVYSSEEIYFHAMVKKRTKGHTILTALDTPQVKNPLGKSGLEY